MACTTQRFQEQAAAKFEIPDDSPTSTGDDKWEEFKAKKDAFFSNLKTKFSNQEQNEERRSSNGKNQKVFIPAVHVFMQPNVIHQRKKIQRKTSCPDMMQTRVRVKTIARNSSLPVFSERSEPISPRKKCPSESSETEVKYEQITKVEADTNTVIRVLPTRKVTGIQRLQSVEEGQEGE